MRQGAEPAASASPGAASSEPSGRVTALHLISLSAAAFALYALALRNGFVADDRWEVRGDPLIRSLRNIPQFFSHSVWYFLGSSSDRYYRPLKLVAYTLEYRLFGFHAAAWHAANLLFHIAAVIALYLLVRDLASRQLAFWTALLFAFHPIHVEAVAWIAAGNDLLCGLMLLLALWLYHRARSSPSAPLGTSGSPKLNYSFSALFFFAALLFKETALVFPAILLAYDFFYRRESPWEILRGWARYVGYVVVLGAYLVMRWHALGGFAPDNPDLHLTRKQFLLTVPVLAIQYLWKSLVPVHLNAWYTFHPVTALGWQTVAAAGLLLLLVWAMFRLRPRQPLLSFALAWFWLMLVPVLDIRKVGDNVFTERYLYIPTFGFCILAAWAWLRLLERAPRPAIRRTACAGIAAILVLCALVILRRLPDWSDNVRLWAKTAQQDPSDLAVLNAAGVAYNNEHRYQEALRFFSKVVAGEPARVAPHSNLGTAYLGLARREDALRQFQIAITLNPADPYAYNDVGAVYLDSGRYDQALPYFQKAVALKPNFAPFWASLALTYRQTDDWQDVVTACRRGLASAGNNQALFTLLGLGQWNLGQHDRAIAAYRRAIAADPAILDAYIDLARGYAQLGQADAAAAELAAALRANPDSPDAYLVHFELGVIDEGRSRWQPAAAEYQQALKLNPNFGAARARLQPLLPFVTQPNP